MKRAPALGATAAGVACALGLAGAGPGALVPLRAVLTASAEVSVAFVVDFGSHAVKACVHVPAGTNGYGALAAFTDQENMASPTYASSGLLCSIDGVPATGCGQEVPGGYIYWAYFHGTSGSWQYANTGAFEDVTTGDVEGWRFEDPGTGEPGDPPPAAPPDFAAICGSVVPSTTATSVGGTVTAPPALSPQSSASSSVPSPGPGDTGHSDTTVPKAVDHTTTPAGPAASGPTSTTAATGSAPARAPTFRAAGSQRAGARGNALVPVLVTSAIVVLLGTAAGIGWRRRRAGAP